MPNQLSDAELAYYSLVETLRLLALSAAEQKDALPDYVVLADERTLTFDDAHQMVPRLREDGRLAQDGWSTVEQIHVRFAAMTNHG